MRRLVRYWNRLNYVSRTALILFLFVVLFADFLANEKPIYCQHHDKSYFPVLIEYGVQLRIRSWPEDLWSIDWSAHHFERSVYPLVPFSHHTISKSSGAFDEPGSRNQSRIHYLGTDKLGRDVAAGMIHGTRLAFFVGILSVFISWVIGVFFGVLAGYFGDYRLGISITRLIWNIFLALAGWFYAFALFDPLQSGSFPTGLMQIALIVLAIFIAGNGFYALIAGIIKIKTPVLALRLDFIISRGIEIFTSIPGLFLLLALLAVVQKSSIWNVIVILGIIRWPSFARLARAEMLAIREENYIQSARVLGMPDWRIILKHALPNGMDSVMVASAFGVAVAILLESSLSFLGIGLSPEQVSWGSMLGQARGNISAWWLSVFPGLAIFGIIVLFNGMAKQLKVNP